MGVRVLLWIIALVCAPLGLVGWAGPLAYGQSFSQETGSAEQARVQRHWTDPWTDSEIEALVLALSEAWTHGLNPADYVNPDDLKAMEAGAARDRLARDTWFDYAEDLAFGRVDPRRLDPDWTQPVRDQDLMTWYQNGREYLGIGAALDGLAPQNPDYTALRAALLALTALPETRVPIRVEERIEKGMSGPVVDALRARLYEEGLLSQLGEVGQVFDRQLETAVMRFQTRYNLAADGKVGETTLAELNASQDQRVDQLKANLERWRWLPADLGQRHIRVNLADYRLEAWANGQVERVHDTMIGKTYASTPTFSENMSIVEINPWWLTPGGLGRPWLRAFRNNPGYAYSRGYRLVDLDSGRHVRASQADWANRRYRVVQAPGPQNAMGKVKFLFPNRHNVYIHDTPHRHLFANNQRDDSSGCVRVQDPEALAVWVLNGEGWTAEQVREAFDERSTQRVQLENVIPVHIHYFTAVTDHLGDVRFVHDVYDRDQALIEALRYGLPDLNLPLSSEPVFNEADMVVSETMDGADLLNAQTEQESGLNQP